MPAVKTSRGTLEIKTGTEGPRHDPYSYTEYSIILPDGREVTMHEGLGEYLKVDGEVVTTGYDNYHKMLQEFIRLTGIDPHQVEKYRERAKFKRATGSCPEGGKHKAVWQHGHPGEHLLICQKCDEILDSRFVRSEIE